MPAIWKSYLTFQGTSSSCPVARCCALAKGSARWIEAIRFCGARVRFPVDLLWRHLAGGGAEHVSDVRAFGHSGSDAASAIQRANESPRHLEHALGENISYGKSTARDWIIALIIDDGLRAGSIARVSLIRHSTFAGAAVGRIRGILRLTIDFRGWLSESEEETRSLFARN